SQLLPDSSVGAPADGRRKFGGTYDGRRDRLLVFGGQGSLGDHNDTWAISLGASPAWSPLATTGDSLPVPRSGHSVVYDSNRDRLVVFGGSFASAGGFS